MTSINQLNTPCLLLERDRLLANIDGMKSRINAMGCTLRAHLKTSKSATIAALLVDDANPGITVSTLKEADYFAGHGYRNILYAVSLVPSKVPKVAQLLRRSIDMCCIVDSLEATGAIAEQARTQGVVLRLMIEIDCDGMRAGLLADSLQLLTLAQFIDQSPHLDFAGVMTHAGGSYALSGAQALAAMAEQERSNALLAAQRIRQLGIACDQVSVGSTPTATFAESFEGVTEVRAGVFVFQDLFQASIGVCAVDDIALSVLTSVIAHKPDHNRILTDAGGLALSKDRSTGSGPEDFGYGQVCRAENCAAINNYLVRSVNQEHGILEMRNGSAPDFAAQPIDSKLRILPNHACMTAAAYDRYYVVDKGQVVDEWTRCNGW